MTDLLLNNQLLQGISNEQYAHNGVNGLKDDPTESLKDRIADMIAHGATLELIVLAIMTNDSANGAMDACSTDIATIVKETNELSDVQDDLIELQRILSKIEDELGLKKDISPDDWKKFDKALLKQLKNVYEKLCKDQKTLAGNTDPKLKLIAESVDNLIKEFNKSIPTPSGDKGSLSSFADLLKNWDGNTDFPLKGKDLANTLCGAVFALAKNFYDKNHPGSGDANIDCLGGWSKSVQVCEQLTSGTSQQETTAVQGFMQILNSFNNIAQQGIQSSSQGKEALIRNQKSG